MSLSRPLSRPARAPRTRRLWAGLAALAVAAATPALGQVPVVAAAPGDLAFVSSFEAGQRPLDWTSTVEAGPDGAPKAAGVTGPAGAGIPGQRVVARRLCQADMRGLGTA
jgi:hypothetical protein